MTKTMNLPTPGSGIENVHHIHQTTGKA